MMDRRRILFAALASFVPGAALADDFIRVPVEFSEVGAPIVSVLIEGQGPYHFMIDTGAVASGIRSPLARKLNLSISNYISISGLGGHKESTPLYTAKEMVLGGALRQAGVALFGIKNLDELPEIEGVMAAGFLTSFPTELDYEAKEIRIHPKTRPDLSDFTPIPSFVETDGGMGGSSKISVNITIDGMPLKVGLDTGSASELLLFSDTVHDMGLWNKYAPYVEGSARGVTGDPIATRLVTLPNFMMGGIKLESLPVRLLDPKGNSMRSQKRGLLGTRLLRQFTVAVNPRSGVSLKANRDFVAPKL